MALSLWHKLFMEANVSWIVLEGCSSLLSERHQGFGGGKKAKVLFLLDYLDGENKRFFEDYKG